MLTAVRLFTDSFALFPLISLLKKRNIMRNFLWEIRNVDFDFIRVGIIKRSKRGIKTCILSIILLMLSFGFMMRGEGLHGQVFIEISVFCGNISTMGAMTVVQESLREITDRMFTVNIVTKNAAIRLPLTYKDLRKLDALANISSKLRRAATTLKGVLSAHMFFGSATLFLRFLVMAYLTTRLIGYGIDPKMLLHLAREYFMVVYIIATMVFPCCQATKASHQIYEKLYEMCIDDETETLVQNERLKLHLYTRGQVEFSAYGVFKLDLPLLHGIAAAVASYVVILLQLQQQKP
ncbi:hypothetical protein GE061_016333 [Apolygus lucorum]|uniref:Gustatory receptor n=1 Tax=Apolygus lucorum TaxID=248454 RepID=A0A6A4K183_APOLU|nr:hypothetical protein GE061_016333 [Apolygus lucorum]